MKKYLYVFRLSARLFVSQNVHASSPSYDVLYYGGILDLDTWDDATYEEELVYYFKDSYRGQYVSLGTAGKYATRLCNWRYRQRLRWKVVIFKENLRLRI